eukprot:g33951.t1
MNSEKLTADTDFTSSKSPIKFRLNNHDSNFLIYQRNRFSLLHPNPAVENIGKATPTQKSVLDCKSKKLGTFVGPVGVQ